jgi:hypothetical protein
VASTLLVRQVGKVIAAVILAVADATATFIAGGGGGTTFTQTIDATVTAVVTLGRAVSLSLAAVVTTIADLTIDATVALAHFTGHAGLGMLDSSKTRWKARKGWAAKRNTWKPKR